MDARVEKKGNVVVVHLSGRIDYESTDSFRSTCLQTLSNEKVVFNLENLNFVGSSGITTFVQTMSDLKRVSPNGLKFCRVSSEFKRVFESSPLKEVEVFETVEMATISFQAQDASNPQLDAGFVEG